MSCLWYHGIFHLLLLWTRRMLWLRSFGYPHHILKGSIHVVKEKLTELATVFQEEDTQDDLLRFWIPLVLGVFFGILLIGSLIAGLLKWSNYRARNNQSLLGINIEGNWVYGSKVQDKAALTAENGQNLAPVEDTK